MKIILQTSQTEIFTIERDVLTAADFAVMAKLANVTPEVMVVHEGPDPIFPGAERVGLSSGCIYHVGQKEGDCHMMHSENYSALWKDNLIRNQTVRLRDQPCVPDLDLYR